MNEQIKDLAKQAGFFPDLNWDHTNWHTAGFSEQFEKFALLIIQECLDIMNDESYNVSMLLSNPPQSSAIWDAKNTIKSHFGIK